MHKKVVDMLESLDAELFDKICFVDDSLLVVLAEAKHEIEITNKIQEAFDGMHPCMKFTYLTISMHITGKKLKTRKPLKFLAINLIPTLYDNHDFIIETQENIKDASESPFSITPFSSAQPKAVMLARISTTRHHNITLSSSE